MRTLKSHEARATFSSVMDRALAGEPQRVTRHGGAAVVIVSEEDWRRTVRSRGLGHFLVDFAERYGADLEPLPRIDVPLNRPLGQDFLDE